MAETAPTAATESRPKRPHFIIPGNWATALPHLGFRLESNVALKRSRRRAKHNTLDVKPSFRGGVTAMFKRIGQFMELGRRPNRSRPIENQAAETVARVALKKIVKKL